MNDLSNWRTFQRHDLSEIFPDMSEVEFESLCADIHDHGYDQKQPVILYEWKILDGWHRCRAAVIEGKSPTFEHYKGKDPLGEVIRRNLHRRHLDASGRAMVAGRIANLGEGRSGPTTPKGVVENASTTPKGGVSQAQAAKALNVSVRSVQRATEVLKKGTEDLQKAVDDGTVTVTDAAAVASEPPAVQDDAVKKVRKRKAKTATEAVGKSDADETVPELNDEVGHLVPELSMEAFSNLEKFKALDTLTRSLQKGIDDLSRERGGEQLLRQLQPTGDEAKRINKSEHLNALKRDIRFTRPYSVCPYCDGKAKASCKGCSGTGWVTKITWDNADEQTKARIA